MATTATPFGLKPVQLLGGTSFAGATRQYKIANNYGTNIFNGSIVKIVAAGGIELMLDRGTNADQFDAATIGVFVGCSYTSPESKQVVFSNYYPASTAADDIVAYVVDDPNTLFKAQADDTLAATARGANIHLAAVQSGSTGNTTTGNSTSALDASEIATTNTFPFRIVDFTNDALNEAGDAYTEVIVKFNAHFYTQTTGV
jgi:hypothetical protein